MKSPPFPKARIAVLVHSLNEGGSQKRVVSLANGFAGRGHAVDLVAVSGKGSVGRLLEASVRQTVLAPTRLPLPRSLTGVGALTAYLERERPDVLMAGSAFSHALAALACARMRAPPLLVLRAASHPMRQLPWSRPWKRLREYGRRPVERWALRRADLIIAVSRESAAAIARIVGERSKVVAVPNPTIPPLFALRSASGSPIAGSMQRRAVATRSFSGSGGWRNQRISKRWSRRWRSPTGRGRSG